LALSVDDLEIGAVYLVSSPHLEVAIWTGEEFVGPASLLPGQLEARTEKHYEFGLPFGTCTPRERVGSYTMAPPFNGRNLMIALEAFSEHILTNKERKRIDEAN
jgi:hypothetical protein